MAEAGDAKKKTQPEGRIKVRVEAKGPALAGRTSEVTTNYYPYSVYKSNPSI